MDNFKTTYQQDYGALNKTRTYSRGTNSRQFRPTGRSRRDRESMDANGTATCPGSDAVGGAHINQEVAETPAGPQSPALQLGGDVQMQIQATVYGQCIGDAIGILTEFMSSKQAHKHYGEYAHDLRFEDRVKDGYRRQWDTGDWTDDSDQMILIMQSITENGGKVSMKSFAEKLDFWSKYGFPELGDRNGAGIGTTTLAVIDHRDFLKAPSRAAKDIWEKSGKSCAANGGVMRTCIMGIHEFWDLNRVVKNARTICETSHFDPRCQASCVAVSVAIALMLQRKPPYLTANGYNVSAIISECFRWAKDCLDAVRQAELEEYLRCDNLRRLKLDEAESIGYTFKCLGAGFWALKQDDFKKAISKIVMAGGDADTNAAVAGALLACKLQKMESLHPMWLDNLKNKEWLNRHLEKYLQVLGRMYQQGQTDFDRSQRRRKREDVEDDMSQSVVRKAECIPAITEGQGHHTEVQTQISDQISEEIDIQTQAPDQTSKAIDAMFNTKPRTNNANPDSCANGANVNPDSDANGQKVKSSSDSNREDLQDEDRPEEGSDYDNEFSSRTRLAAKCCGINETNDSNIQYSDPSLAESTFRSKESSTHAKIKAPLDESITVEIREQIIATLYGQCMGDAIGLLSEYMSRKNAKHHYGHIKELEYKHKQNDTDAERSLWKEGDWSDDTDQMILIMQSAVEKDGEINPMHYAQKLHTWMLQGFSELGDWEGLGVGSTTYQTLNHPKFLTHPYQAAEIIWQNGNRDLAPNGGVMRTSILGIHNWWDVDKVEENAVAICKVTHRDPRCQASAVAVSVAISLMLQNKYFDGKKYNLRALVADVLKRASKYLERDPDFARYTKDLKFFLECKSLQDLYLDERHSIGYTFKCVGAGFWALKQKDFRYALQQIVLSGGDADTNGAVAGALLACKLRHRDKLPKSWTTFPHKAWLDDQIERYLVVLGKRHQLHLLRMA